MKLLVTRVNRETELLDIAMPVAFTAHDNPNVSMWLMHDAQGTDYFFNKSDGTYDGWGRAVMCNAEAEELLHHAAQSKAAPKIKIS